MKMLLSRILSFNGCSHQFSWPRKLPDGYYQVCVLCGDEYTYDWNSMSRTGRINPNMASGAVRRQRAPRRTGWVLREGRLQVSLPVQFRAKLDEAWQYGTVENVSESGVLICSVGIMPAVAALELIFDMPVAISGRRHTTVLCEARVVRRIAANSGQCFAAAICSCHVLAKPPAGIRLEPAIHKVEAQSTAPGRSGGQNHAKGSYSNFAAR